MTQKCSFLLQIFSCRSILGLVSHSVLWHWMGQGCHHYVVSGKGGRSLRINTSRGLFNIGRPIILACNAMPNPSVTIKNIIKKGTIHFFRSRLSMIMRVNVVLNRTVVVDNLLCTNSTPPKCNKTTNLNVSLGKK